MILHPYGYEHKYTTDSSIGFIINSILSQGKVSRHFSITKLPYESYNRDLD